LIVARTIAELKAARSATDKIGFVPTMGALHEGHLSLIRRAAADYESACVSIFVNPLQFGPGEDLANYPRTEEEDFEAARSAGCKLMFAPQLTTMVKEGTSLVTVPEVSALWEGHFRPGHFVGVATIVLKLFNLVRPSTAYFGWKDFQQCIVIRRMVEDLFVPTNLQFCETVREADGLAMSSRNRYLSIAERAIAPEIFLTLTDLRASLKGDVGVGPDEILGSGAQRLRRAGFVVDYLAWIDESTLKPISRWQPQGRIIVAAKIGTTRLIDNISTD